jgi:hypothetical protein
MSQFLHIAFNWSGEPKITELKPVFDQAIDWIRYAPNCWIVWTSNGPDKWYERLKPHLGTSDHMFICSIDMNTRSGWLPKTTWEWITKTR